MYDVPVLEVRLHIYLMTSLEQFHYIIFPFTYVIYEI